MTNKKRLGLSIPFSLYQKIVEQAHYKGWTLNSTCLEIFWNYFEKSDGQDREIKGRWKK